MTHPIEPDAVPQDGDSYDLIVVGSGAGGLSAAVTAAYLGLRVAVANAGLRVAVANAGLRVVVSNAG